MFEFAEKKPILFEIILIVISFIAVVIFTVFGNALYLSTELSTSIGRIIVGIALIFIYHRAFSNERPFKDPVIMLPSLLFAVWNVVYNLSSGAVSGGMSYYTEALVTALAPAIFEEVLFRGIFICNLKKSGKSDMVSLLISAAFFSALHLTNIVGSDPISVALQVGYSFVVGLALGAIYLRNNSIIQVIFVHFLIDFTNRIYLEPVVSSTVPQLILFGLLLVIEAVYAIRLCFNNSK